MAKRVVVRDGDSRPAQQLTAPVDDLDSFFDVSLDLFCFAGIDGYFKRLNPAWETTLGFTREELMSRPFIEFGIPTIASAP